MRHLIRQMEEITRETFPKNIEVRTSVSPDLWTVLADPTQLHQVLLNLCVNARDAMPGGGCIALTAENVTLDAQYAAMNLDAGEGPHVVIQVEDTGTGIPPALIDKIFDPFFTTKEVGKGTGLGLSTSLAIVKSHGGFLRVYSEPGAGTRFRVCLPAQPGEHDEVFATETVQRTRGRGELVLVVDDEAAIRQITRQTLEASGYRVRLAADGAEAVAACAEHKRDIAVVVIDMMMPVMDGASAIQVLTTIDPAIRIIAVSGITMDGTVARAAGATRFLPKPYTAGTLLTALRQVLDADGGVDGAVG